MLHPPLLPRGVGKPREWQPEVRLLTWLQQFYGGTRSATDNTQVGTYPPLLDLISIFQHYITPGLA